MSSKKGRVVVKIGSALLTDNGKGLNHELIKSFAEQMSVLQKAGYDVVLVSSGAIAAGVVRLGWSARPNEMAKLQAAAAVGQSQLVKVWEDSFGASGVDCALILLDASDLANRERYLNARSALLELLSLNVIPIINENDTVVTDEIRFGDNDSLAGLVANLVDADQLIILTDQNGLYTADPRIVKDATLIERASAEDQKLSSFAQGSKGELGRGGMQTKLAAARLAARSGTNTFIGSGLCEDILVDAVDHAATGTYLDSGIDIVAARKQWLGGMMSYTGELIVDLGAETKLQKNGASLLPVGVVEVRGIFSRGDLVLVKSVSGTEIAKGLINFSHIDAKLVVGKKSLEMFETLGVAGEAEMIHRDNLVLL